MSTVAKSTEVQNAFGKFLEASQREPVTIEKSGRPVATLVSYTDFEALQDAASKNALTGHKTGKPGFASPGSIRFSEDDDQWLKAMKCFNSVGDLSDNWDGNGSKAPSEQALDYAFRLVTSIYTSACRRNTQWVAPHVGANEEGTITLEWWYLDRDLTLYVEPNGDVAYLKSWGENIHDQMEDGMVQSLDDYVRLSKWLFQGKVK